MRYSNSIIAFASISVQHSKVFERCYSSAMEISVIIHINCTHFCNGLYILLHNKIVMNYSAREKEIESNFHFSIYVIYKNIQI